MAKTFPGTRDLLTEVRQKMGTARLLPPGPIAHATVGTAIDWWLRFLAQPGVRPRMDIAEKGLDRLEGHPAHWAGKRMFDTITGLQLGEATTQFHQPLDPLADLTDQPEEFQARTCVALALLTDCFRVGLRPGSRLLDIPAGSGPGAMLELATDTEVADLIALRLSAEKVFLPWIEQPVHTGPTFAGSHLVPGDADLISGETFIEFKATSGARPRKDGNRAYRIDPVDIYQMLAYLLMDYTDSYRIQHLGLYAVRFERYLTWDVDEFLDKATSSTSSLLESPSVASLRGEFHTLLRHTHAQLIGNTIAKKGTHGG